MTPRSGQLLAEPLPALLQGLYKEKLTCVLSLDASGGRSEVFFAVGYPVGVNSGGAIDQLGQVMVDAAMIDAATLRENAALLSPDGEGFGRALIALGAISEAQLREALLMQIRRRLHRLFFFERGTFTIVETQHDVGVIGDELLRVQPRRAIYHGIRGAWNAARVARATVHLDGKALRLRADATTLSRYGLSEGDARVAEAIAARSLTLEEIVAASAQPMEAVRGVACVLHFTGELEVSAAAPARARTATPIQPQADVAGLTRLVAAKLAEVDTGDFFRVLVLERSATPEQVKAAYLSAAKVFHPDRFAAGGLEGLRPDVERLFRHINEAYATLHDDVRRAAYVARREAPPQNQADVSAARSAVDAEVAFLRGKVFLKKRDFAGAVESFTRSVELNPIEGEHLAMLAWARVAAGSATLGSIRVDLDQAIAKSPRCAAAHHFLGVVLREAGDLDGAIAALKKAVRLDPRLTEAESELRVTTLRKEKGGKRR